MIHLRPVNDNLHEAREDIEKLRKHIASISRNAEKYIDIFVDLKNKNKISGAESDVYFWLKKPAQDLIDFIDEKSVSLSKSQVKKGLKLAGSRFICENDDWIVYSITTHSACRYYGRNTKWCITEASDYYWRKYILQGYKFYFCINKKPEGSSFDKLALQCKGKHIYKIWDSLDNSYDPEHLSSLNIPNISEDLKYTSKSRSVGNGLIQTSQCILNVKKSRLDSDVVIPNSISAIPDQEFAHSNIESISFEKNSPLTRLSNGIFYDCNKLYKATLPDNLKILSRGAFHSCDNLAEVKLPESIEILEPYCFADCSNLTKVVIPRNVDIINEGAFKCCKNLEEVYFLSPTVDIDNQAFQDCPKLMIYASEKSTAYNFAKKHNINTSVRA